MSCIASKFRKGKKVIRSAGTDILNGKIVMETPITTELPMGTKIGRTE